MSLMIDYFALPRAERLHALTCALLPRVDTSRGDLSEFFPVATRTSGLEADEERVLRRLLPLVDLSRLDDSLQQRIMVEFPALRAPDLKGFQEADFGVGRMYYDGYLIMSIGRVGERDAVFSALYEGEETENWRYLVALPSVETFDAFKKDDICLRALTLAPSTALMYVSHEHGENQAYLKTGPVVESELPEKGLFYKDCDLGHPGTYCCNCQKTENRA